MATKLLPEPIYLNQKEGAAFIRVKENFLNKAHKDGLINRYKRQGKGFVYKIKELLALADSIDKEQILIS